MAGHWGEAATHVHCGQFFPGQGRDYTVRVNRMREAISYHHLLPGMMRTLGLARLDPAEICLAPELKAFPPPPPRRRRRRVAMAGREEEGFGGEGEGSLGRQRSEQGPPEGRGAGEGGRRRGEATPLASSRRGLLRTAARGADGAPRNGTAGGIDGAGWADREEEGGEDSPHPRLVPPPAAAPLLSARRRRRLTRSGGEPQPAGAAAVPPRPPLNDWFCPEVAGVPQVDLGWGSAEWDLNER